MASCLRPRRVRLLRVLQEGSFERVGGERSVSVDVRIIASAHRDLPAMVQNGQFRQDLWYRIAGFPIVLPPLREDTAALAAHFVERATRHFGLRPTKLTPQDVEPLTSYDWPGNVRERISVTPLSFDSRTAAIWSRPTAPTRPHCVG